MALVRFPQGEAVMTGRPFDESVFGEVDRLLGQGQCPEGWLDFERGDTRLTCLIHESRPFLAGLTEPERFSSVPLSDLVTRARGLEGAVCSLVRADLVRVLLLAVHFRNRPVLQADTRFVDLTHVLDVLAAEAGDAALALERGGKRTLLFLQKGVPTRIYFGNPKDDPGGESVSNRFLLYGFDPRAPSAKVEVFNRLNIQPDSDAGRGLAELAAEAKPPPPMDVMVRQENKAVIQRPFMPPYMIIGRDHTCEIMLASPSVSRRHARLLWRRGRFVIEDLGSANGTTVNQSRIERRDLQPGDRVGAGVYELQLAPVEVAVDPKATVMMVPGEQESSLYLAGEEQSVELAAGVTIGKARGVDLRANGFRVKSVHARVQTAGSGVFQLACLDGANVRLNGDKVTKGYLKSGDRIQIGRSSFQVISVPNP